MSARRRPAEAFPEFGRELRCGCCRRCHELRVYRGGRWIGTGRCIYGGPYRGFQLPDGRLERLDNLERLESSAPDLPRR